MANHVIRDRIWESKKLARCSRDAALAYPWIFLVADDHGRFEFNPRRIWSKVFGIRSDISLKEVGRWLDEYVQVGLLYRYHIDGDLAVWTGFMGRPPTQRRESTYPDPGPLPEGYGEPSQALGDDYPRSEIDRIGADQSKSRDRAPARSRRAVVMASGTSIPANDTAENRAPIEAYNATFGTSIGPTPGNLRASARALEAGYTLEQMRQTFEAIKARATLFAAWCASHDREFEYIVRPDYTNKRTGEFHQAAIDKILNELATGRKELA